jgi:hypothetical protein
MLIELTPDHDELDTADWLDKTPVNALTFG